MKVITQKRKISIILLASILMDFMGAGLILPILPFYAKSFGASSFEIAFLFGLLPLTSIFAPALWGSLSDRIGRRPALLFNIAGTTLSFLVLSVASSLEMLFLSQLLAGAASASIVIAQSYILDLTTTENRIKALSFLEAAAGVGFVLGPALGALLMGGGDDLTPNFRLPGMVAAVTSGLTFSLAFIALPRLKDKPVKLSAKPQFSPRWMLTEIKQTIQRPLIGSIIWVGFIVAFTGMGCQAIFALWCETRFGWGAQQFSYLIVFYALMTVVMQVGLTEKLAQQIGEIKLLLLSLGALALGLLLLPMSTTVPHLIFPLLLLTFSTAMGSPTLTSLLSQLSGANQQGKTLGLLESVSGAGGFLGPLMAGISFGAFGENSPYWLNGILMLVCTFLAWCYITQLRLKTLMDSRRRQKLIHLFELFDRDQSGNIELQDFHQVGFHLAKLRGWQLHTPNYTMLQASLEGFFGQLRQLADQDGNQKIDQAEWLICLEQHIDYDFASFFLKIIDTNQDGQVEISELKTFYQVYGIHTEGIEEAFDTLDFDQDGYISQEELRIIFAQFLKSDDIQSPGNWIFGVHLPTQL